MFLKLTSQVCSLASPALCLPSTGHIMQSHPGTQFDASEKPGVKPQGWVSL